jgi:hypothetical protein
MIIVLLFLSADSSEIALLRFGDENDLFVVLNIDYSNKQSSTLLIVDDIGMSKLRVITKLGKCRSLGDFLSNLIFIQEGTFPMT